MMQQSNEIPIYSYIETTNIGNTTLGNTNAVPIYDDIPEEENPPPVPPRLYQDDETSTT